MNVKEAHKKSKFAKKPLVSVGDVAILAISQSCLTPSPIQIQFKHIKTTNFNFRKIWYIHQITMRILFFTHFFHRTVQTFNFLFAVCWYYNFFFLFSIRNLKKTTIHHNFKIIFTVLNNFSDEF